MPSGETPTGSAPSGEMQSENTDTNSSTSYQTAQDYIDYLNGNDTWIQYDEKTNTAKITSLEAFVKIVKILQNLLPLLMI